MLIFALLSGLINLSSQVVFQKIVSMVAGDLYTTFLAVTLTFIIGSAIGSYFGNYFRRYLAWIEGGTGLFNLTVYFLLSGTFYSYNIPLALVIAGLILPAVALGTHIPLYSYYLRQLRFGWIYSIYHVGGIFGLLAIEYYFSTAGSVRDILLCVSVLQILLGIIIGILTLKNKFQVQESPFKAHHELSQILKLIRGSWPALCASILSFYGVIWALKTQTLITETLRLHATSVSSAVFFWMAVAGMISPLFRKWDYARLYALMATIFLAIYGAFSFAVVAITDQVKGDLPGYFAMAFVLSLFLTAPVLVSSLVFIRAVQKLQSQFDVDVASGFLNLVAGFGNLLGFILAATLAAYFWDGLYFAIPVGLCLVLMLVVSALIEKPYSALIGGFGIAALAGVLLQQSLVPHLFVNRVPREFRFCHESVDVEVHSHPLTTMALFTSQTRPTVGPECWRESARRYVIDGHISHNIWKGDEIYVGLAGIKYLEEAPQKSLVIGIGSGQSAFGVAAVSESTDLVEISPVVVKNLDLLADQNGNVRHHPHVSFLLDDGFNVVRNCQPKSYDMILNTSTYPSSFNASKLYSDEFAKMASECLSDRGVYHTYFDGNSVQNLKDFYEFLAPLHKHFAHVDVMLDPYPQVFAYKAPRALTTLTAQRILRVEDRNFMQKAFPKFFDAQCANMYRDIPSKPAEMTTLDQAVVERNTIRNLVSQLRPNNPYNEFTELILSEKLPRTCE